MKRDILSLFDLSSDEFTAVIERALGLKEERNTTLMTPYCAGQTLGMIFEKASTRTRISFEVGMYELGGHAIFLTPQDMQLGRGEEIPDTARVLSRYLSGIMIRSNHHQTIVDLATHATIPVINGLSDHEHPCQILADIMTIREHFGHTEGLCVTWVGDGNNVCNSLVLASAYAGFKLHVSVPKGYEPDMELVQMSRNAGGTIEFFDNPKEAAVNADVLYTDTWVSMGSEDETAARKKIFAPYTVNEALVAAAHENAIVMHCLPAHRGDEITNGVMDGAHSAVWDQAENRLHAQKALLLFLLTNNTEPDTN